MTNLEKIATDCRAAADYYRDKPGHAGADTMIDLYLTIKRLTEEVDRWRRSMADHQSGGASAAVDSAADSPKPAAPSDIGRQP